MMEGLKEISSEEHIQIWENVPLGMGGGPPKSKAQAMLHPGCCVKSKEIESTSSWPKYFGKVASHSDDKVVVVSHDAPLYMWEGTHAEYISMWDCD